MHFVLFVRDTKPIKNAFTDAMEADLISKTKIKEQAPTEVLLSTFVDPTSQKWEMTVRYPDQAQIEVISREKPGYSRQANRQTCMQTVSQTHRHILYGQRDR